MPQIKFSRPEDGETSVVGRGGVRKVRGQSPDDDSRSLDLVYVYETPEGPPVLHAIARGLPRAASDAPVDAPLPRWQGPERQTHASGYAPQERGVRRSFYDRTAPAAAERRNP
jgi:hypothetical protein